MAGLRNSRPVPWIMTFSQESRGQFAAIAQLRWRLFVNSLRTIRGNTELISHLVIALLFVVFGLGGALGLGAGAYYLLSQGKTEWLAALLWPVFLFWQLFPIMTSAFSDTSEPPDLLRFPLDFRAYFLVRMGTGLLDPVTIAGSLWLLGAAAGITFARPMLLPWAVLVLLAFALFNLLLTRMIFLWLERWLAQRRTREIMSVLFFFVIISMQFVAPLTRRYGQRSRAGVFHTSAALLPVQRVSPPGLAGDAIAEVAQRDFLAGAGAFLGVCLYAGAAMWLLKIRLAAQYRGENLSEAVARPVSLTRVRRVRVGWDLLGLPGPMAAIVEKELRYLARSGPMLFTLIIPVVMLVVFRLGPSGSGKSGAGFLVRAPDLAFPLGAAYSILLLTNIVYNNFGADSSGIQFFFVSPVRIREVVRAKNIAHAAVYMLEMCIVWTGVCLLYQPPQIDVTLATLAGILFALPLDLAAGDLLSVWMPKKIDHATFGKQRAAQTTVLASFAIRAVIFGTGALVVWLSRLYGNLWLAIPVFLALAALALPAYVFVSARVENIALKRREILVSELGRA